MQNLLFDLRFVLRQLRKSPGFAITAVLMLAFGIGATTAIFSIVEGVLLRPLPFPDSNRLMVLADCLQGADIGSGNCEAGVTVPDIIAYTRETHSFNGLGGYQYAGYELSGNGEPAQVTAARMTAGVFTALGVAPHLGRVFTADEDAHHQQVVLVELWRLAEPLSCRSRHSWNQDSSGSQALRRDRRDAAQLRVSPAVRPAQSDRVVGPDELPAAENSPPAPRPTGAIR